MEIFTSRLSGSSWSKLVMFPIFLLGWILMTGCQGNIQTPPAADLSTPTAPPTVASAAASTGNKNGTVRLTSGEWAPYTGANLQHYGCDSWVVTEAFALEGVNVDYGFFPWARGYQSSESGEWDGAIEWANTPDHQKTHYLSAEPLSKQEWVFFYRKDRPFTWEKIDDLAGKTIGVTIGYAYSDLFEGLKSKNAATFDEAPSDELNFKKLLAGRIDAFPVERRVGYLILASLKPEEQAQIVEHPKPLDEFLPYLLLSKALPQNNKRMELFNQGFKRLQESGRYAEIMKSCAP